MRRERPFPPEWKESSITTRRLGFLKSQPPRSIGRTRHLDSPIVHDLSIDKPVDRDRAHRESLARLGEAMLRLSDIGTVYRHPQHNFIISSEDVVDFRFRVVEHRAPRTGRCPRSFQPARP